MTPSSRLHAVEQLLATHREVLRERIRSRIGPHLRQDVDSEDLVDSALREALQRAADPGSPEIENLPAWLWKAAVSKLHDAGRKAARKGAGRAERVDDLKNDEKSPSSHARGSEESELLFDLLARLKPKDEVAIRHYYILGLRGQELGDSLGVSSSAAAHRVERALGRLRALAEGKDEQ